MKDTALENSVVSLHQRGWSLRHIAKELHISRARINRILLSHQNLREHGHQTIKAVEKQASKLDPYKEFIHQLLGQDLKPKPTGERIYELISEKGYQGGISILRDYLIKITGKKKAEVIHTTETPAGQRGQHDWSEYKIRFTLSDKIEKVLFFSFILSYSRRQYIQVVENENQTTLFRCLINSFTHLGGVPLEIKADNQKNCVDRWEAGRPVFNSHYLEFATHYRFRPLTIRPGRPQENLKIERPFYYLETNFLNARSFRDAADLQAQLQDWLRTKNDLRIHHTTKRQPLEMHQQELPHLQALPQKPFDTSTVVYRIVNREACISWNGYFFAVPDAYLFESCPVRITADELIVYSPDCQPIVIHKLPAPNSKQRYVGKQEKQPLPPAPDAKDVIERLKDFGPEMEEFIGQIKVHKPKNYLYHLRQILSYKVNYKVDDILIAVARASRYKVFEASAIANFLSVNALAKNEIQLMDKKPGPYEK